MLDQESVLGDVFSEIKRRGFTKVPVYETKTGRITGILHLWDAVRIPERDYGKTKIGRIARGPTFAYSDERISELLVELKEHDTHMAIILDKDDNLEGCITVEDLLEEIVGDIIGEAKR